MRYLLFLMLFLSLFSCQKKQSLEKALQNPDEVTELNLSDQNLTSLSPEIAKLKSLVVLRLDGNKLKELPKEIASLKNLRELNLSWNDLETYPSQINQLSQLEKLGLACNHLSALPKEVSLLNNLKELTLFGNPITDKEDTIQALLPRTSISFYVVLPENMGHHYFSKAVIAYNKKDYAKTLQYCTKSIQYNPSLPNPYSLRGMIRYNTGDKKGACEDWQAAAQLGDKQSVDFLNQYCK